MAFYAKRPAKSSVRQRAIANGYKSGLEDKVSDQIANKGHEVKYEDPDSKIHYVQPETKHTYKPDFVLPNGIIIETKGRLVMADRKKHILIKKQHPELDVRFVFDYAKGKISKSSKTTYADWCIKHGFLYAEKLIPESWFEE